MKEVRVLRARCVCAVQADDVEVLIFDPDTAEEAPFAGIFLWRDIEHEAADVAQELAADVFEIVVLTVEVVAVGKHHPRKAEGLILHLEILGEAAEKALLHALVFQIGSAIDGLAEVHAAEEIPIIFRNRTKLRILDEVLEIGLDDRCARREHLGQTLFALDKSVDHLVHGWPL